MTAPSRRSAENQKLKTTGNDAAEKLNEHCEKGQVRGYRAHLDIRSRHQLRVRRVVALFAAVSKGDARPVVDGLAACFEHFFLGDHALGGSRFTLEKTRLWYERLYRLLPDISFDLRAIRISGPPWNTLVAVDWLESNSGTDGVRTFTPGVHVVRLAWGRMTYIGIYPDTVGLVATLQRLSRAGIAEATAEKIEG
jgi:ketosteroid isomerase-like protein